MDTHETDVLMNVTLQDRRMWQVHHLVTEKDMNPREVADELGMTAARAYALLGCAKENPEKLDQVEEYRSVLQDRL